MDTLDNLPERFSADNPPCLKSLNLLGICGRCMVLIDMHVADNLRIPHLLFACIQSPVNSKTTR